GILIERLDHVLEARIGLHLAEEQAARGKHELGRLRRLVRIDGAAKTETVNILAEIDHFKDMERPLAKLLLIADAGKLVIVPVGMDVVRRVAAQLRILDISPPHGRGLILIVNFMQWAMFQAKKQVFAKRRVKNIAMLANIGDAPADDGFGRGHEIEVTHRKTPAVGIDQAGQDMRQGLAPGTGGADNCGPLFGHHAGGQAVEDPVAGIVRKLDIAVDQLPGETRDLVGLDKLVLLIAHSGGLELLDHLFILDARVLAALIIGEKLFPRSGHFLMRADRRDQRTDLKRSVDDHRAADGVEEEGAKLLNEIVQKFNNEFKQIDAVANVIDLAELVRECRPHVVGAIMRPHFLDTAHGLAKLIGENAHETHTLLAEQVDLLLQLRDEIGLKRVKRNRGHRHHPVLDDKKGDDDEQIAALENRHGEGFADKPAERLHLTGNHGDDFAGAFLAECRQGKAENAAVKIEAQAAQHPLPGNALIDIDHIFENLVDDDHKQKDANRQIQKFHLIKFDAGIGNGERNSLAFDRLVDDQFRQFEIVVKRREGQDGQQGEYNLLFCTVAQNILVNAVFHERDCPPPS